MKKTILLLAFASGALLALAAARKEKKRGLLNVVPAVDLDRYAGLWYEIARFPRSSEEDCVGDVTAQYTSRADGGITVVNRCRETDGIVREVTGVARRVSETLPRSVLEVCYAPAFLSFMPSVWGDYQILALADDYTYAMVGTPDRESLWILSRTPTLDEAIYQKLIEEAQAQEFDTSRFVKTPQSGANAQASE